MRTTSFLALILAAGCGVPSYEEYVSQIETKHDGLIVSACGLSVIGSKETQASVQWFEDHLIEAFGPTYPSDDLCRAVSGTTIFVTSADGEIAEGIYSSYTPDFDVVQLPYGYLSGQNTLAVHEMAHAFQYKVRRKLGHVSWKADGVLDAMDRWLQFFVFEN